MYGYVVLRKTYPHIKRRKGKHLMMLSDVYAIWEYKKEKSVLHFSLVLLDKFYIQEENELVVRYYIICNKL